ncbi:MAG TPA: hypothetical protein VFF39_18835 [Verrucomicrobiae bacterium]|nr:hypothetical protein [Verrucomicrobiae bacterium]
MLKHKLLLLLPFLLLVNCQHLLAQFIQVSTPTGLTRDSDGNVWATSFNGNLVIKLQGDGTGGLQGGGQFGTSAILLGAFPVGVSDDTERNVIEGD